MALLKLGKFADDQGVPKQIQGVAVISGIDAAGDPLPSGFDAYAVTRATPTWVAGFPTTMTETVVVGANTYTRTTTNTVTGGNLVSSVTSAWVKT